MQSKTLTKVLKAEQLNKMLHHFETYNFIKMGCKVIQPGFLTENLKEFVKKEWLFTNLISSDHPAFLFQSLVTKENIKNAFSELRNLVNTVPFRLIEVDNSSGVKEDISGPESDTALELVRHQFKKKTGTIMRSLTFCPPQNAVEIFYQRQRESKTWWRKLSASPGRFTTSNISTKQNDRTVTTEIEAEFPWGFETVEVIKYLPDFYSRDKDFEVYTSKRKKSMPHVVSCETFLETAAFTYLCDSYERPNEDPRVVLRLNKKLAPFKVSIAGTATSADEGKSLEELSLLIAKQIRKLGLHVLFLPDSHSASVERQILRNDAMGVPYTILLNEETLKDGTLAIRSRDTTLKEQSHVSLIAQYMGTILK